MHIILSVLYKHTVQKHKPSQSNQTTHSLTPTRLVTHAKAECVLLGLKHHHFGISSALLVRVGSSVLELKVRYGV